MGINWCGRIGFGEGWTADEACVSQRAREGGANTEKVCREPDMSSPLWQTSHDIGPVEGACGLLFMGTRLFSFLFARHGLREELGGIQQQQQH